MGQPVSAYDAFKTLDIYPLIRPYCECEGLRNIFVIYVSIAHALNPIITWWAGYPWFIGGVVLVERVFKLAGVGRQCSEAIETVDVPSPWYSHLYRLVVVLSGILIDLAQAYADPRIRHGRQ